MRYLLMVLGMVCANAHAICDVVDASGANIHLSQPARRIISLAPDLTEIIFAIGADDHLIGVIKGSDYPPAANVKPIVGAYNGIDIEKIISLHPDLIVTWGSTFARSLSVLKQANIPVYVSDPHRLEAVPAIMKQLGCLTGTEQSAQKQAQDFLADLHKLQQHYQYTKPVTVFYQIGSYSLITINKESWINQAIHVCGGVNVFANARFAAPEVSWEAVIGANPQVIVTDSQEKTWQERWLRWSNIAAVKQHHLYAIHPDLLERASPRLLQGVARLCRDLQAARDESS